MASHGRWPHLWHHTGGGLTYGITREVASLMASHGRWPRLWHHTGGGYTWEVASLMASHGRWPRLWHHTGGGLTYGNTREVATCVSCRGSQGKWSVVTTYRSSKNVCVAFYQNHIKVIISLVSRRLRRRRREALNKRLKVCMSTRVRLNGLVCVYLLDPCPLLWREGLRLASVVLNN